MSTITVVLGTFQKVNQSNGEIVQQFFTVNDWAEYEPIHAQFGHLVINSIVQTLTVADTYVDPKTASFGVDRKITNLVANVPYTVESLKVSHVTNISYLTEGGEWLEMKADKITNNSFTITAGDDYNNLSVYIAGVLC